MHWNHLRLTMLAFVLVLGPPAYALDILATTCVYPPGTVSVTATVGVLTVQGDEIGHMNCVGALVAQSEPDGGILCECRPRGAQLPWCTVVVFEEDASTYAACVLTYPQSFVVVSPTKRLRGRR